MSLCPGPGDTRRATPLKRPAPREPAVTKPQSFTLASNPNAPAVADRVALVPTTRQPYPAFPPFFPGPRDGEEKSRKIAILLTNSRTNETSGREEIGRGNTN